MRGWLYHHLKGEEIFEGEAYQAALADGWVDTPAKFGMSSPVVQPAVLDEAKPKNKGGRPKKVME